MKITSDAFADNEFIPKKYTCEGEGMNPALAFAEVPEGTQSLALIVEDPDAPSGDFVHWLMWNIAPDTSEIAEGASPVEAVQGTNDAGREGWIGPCPPSGRHRYRFRLYALNAPLDLPAGAEKGDVRTALTNATLEEALLTGLYQKSIPTE